MTLDLSALPRCILGAQERNAQTVDDQLIQQSYPCTRDQGIWGSEGRVPHSVKLSTIRR